MDRIFNNYIINSCKFGICNCLFSLTLLEEFYILCCMSQNINQEFMQFAINVASSAPTVEVPVGAIVVFQNKVIASCHNTKETCCDPTAHAEISAIRQACKAINKTNLTGCDMYVTMEPCVMCAGAIVNARISNLYFGAYDKRFGGVSSCYNIGTDKKQNHTIVVTGGILQEECSKLLTNFFAKLRHQK